MVFVDSTGRKFCFDKLQQPSVQITTATCSTERFNNNILKNQGKDDEREDNFMSGGDEGTKNVTVEKEPKEKDKEEVHEKFKGVKVEKGGDEEEHDFSIIEEVAEAENVDYPVEEYPVYEKSSKKGEDAMTQGFEMKEHKSK